jgi:hypothetical protein
MVIIAIALLVYAALIVLCVALLFRSMRRLRLLDARIARLDRMAATTEVRIGFGAEGLRNFGKSYETVSAEFAPQSFESARASLLSALDTHRRP